MTHNKKIHLKESKEGNYMDNMKRISLRIPKETWAFLREQSTLKESSINSIIISLIDDMKKNSEKKLKKSVDKL